MAHRLFSLLYIHQWRNDDTALGRHTSRQGGRGLAGAPSKIFLWGGAVVASYDTDFINTVCRKLGFIPQNYIGLYAATVQRMVECIWIYKLASNNLGTRFHDMIFHIFCTKVAVAGWKHLNIPVSAEIKGFYWKHYELDWWIGCTATVHADALTYEKKMTIK